ncbi:MAG: radical SAM protein [Oscillospiraceae bacterium]|nr:radical SAM protein [Oscillospiraceae bacterium]
MYVHVPFCVSRCSYCDFNTYAGMDGHIGAYFEALGQEMNAFFRESAGESAAFFAPPVGRVIEPGSSSCAGGGDTSQGVLGAPYVDTVFIGGGTPSYVDPAYIAGVLGLIPQPPRGEWECTIEVNPGSLSAPFDARGAGSSDALGAQGAGSLEAYAGANLGTRASRPHRPQFEVSRPHHPQFEVSRPHHPQFEAYTRTGANLGTRASRPHHPQFEAYARAGVNRISFGLQSTHDAHLKLLGRAHSFDDFLRSYREAKNAGFENISVDLLFGIPGQTLPEWERTLETVVGLGPRHISCYSLSVEEGTPLHKVVEDGSLARADDEIDRDMYHFAVQYLRSAGLHQYELSNFARPGCECRHNLKYWTGARYRGFGAGAHSYDGGARFSNVASIGEYIERADGGGSPVAEFVPIDEAESEKEFIILRLRLTRGFCDAEFRALFGCGFIEKYGREYDELAGEGLLEAAPGLRVRLTPKGMDLANRVFVRFI